MGELGDVGRRVRDSADEADRSIASFLGNRDRERGLVHVETDVKRLLHAASGIEMLHAVLARHLDCARADANR
jgi:hypothetical protein